MQEWRGLPQKALDGLRRRRREVAAKADEGGRGQTRQRAHGSAKGGAFGQALDYRRGSTFGEMVADRAAVCMCGVVCMAVCSSSM